MEESRGALTVLLLPVEGQLYGVDAAEVERIVPAARDQEPAIRSLAACLGLPEPDPPPAWLILGRTAVGQHGLAVASPQDLVELPLEDIFPLPSLIRRTLPDSPLWGVARRPQGLLLLVHLPGSAGADRISFREER